MSLPPNIFCTAAELEKVIVRIVQGARSAPSAEQITNEFVPSFTDANANRWIDCLAAQLGLETTHENLPFGGFGHALKTAAPLVLQITDSDERRFVVVVGAVGKTLMVIGRDFKSLRLNCSALRDFLFQRQLAAVLPEIESLLARTGVGRHRRPTALQLLLEDRLSGSRTACWTLRLQGGASIWQHAQDVRLPRRFAQLMVSYAFAYILWIISWRVLGLGALQGRFDGGWIGLWALLLLTLIPLRLFATWMQGSIATQAGWICRQKLLHATLRLNPEKLRSSGIGHFLGRALELEAIETVGFSGGVLGLVALIDLAAAATILAFGVAPALQLIALACWSAVISALLLYYFQCRKKWTELRLKMTHDLIERMIGHRTRIVQEAPERWHSGEEAMVENYLLVSKRMDGIAAFLNAFGPRGWVLLSIITLIPTVMSSSASSVSIAITLGGILIGSEAIRKIVTSMIQLADTSIVWGRIRPLLTADAEPPRPVTNLQAAEESNKRNTSFGKLMQVQDVQFQHTGRTQPVLQNCDLHIHRGDRLLLEGSSGSGKSTFVAILSGMRSPTSGLLLLNGLDQQTLGASSWRQRIAGVPQFHENHVFSETFAFNVLMGRCWPAPAEDMGEAEALCRELGLGELLDRMPAGMMQMVGETGWQLSHGERSRMFIARALLQNAEMVVLDESFAALDPDNLRRCMECALKRSKTLLVVAHP